MAGTPIFRALLREARLPLPEEEYAFARDEGRRWRFDFAWPADGMVALEVEGGAWTQGRHTRGAGFLADIDKYNTATLRGWRVFRVVPRELCTAPTIALLRKAISIRAAA